MRRFAILFFMLILSVIAYSQSPIEAFCRNIDGYWGEWFFGNHYNAKGKYNDMIIYESNLHPSEYSIRIIIDDYVEIPKKERKRRFKANEYYTYNGTVEFYLDERVSSVNHWLKQCGAYSMPNKYSPNSKKVAQSAKIRIAPYKDVPEVYFITFDNGGFAISLRTKK